MKLSIIYFNKLQWTEEQFKHYSKERNINIDFIESNDFYKKDFSGSDFILNRVYASVANENNFNFNKFVNSLKKLETKRGNFVNSSLASICDYDKYFSSKLMDKKGILNPETEKVFNLDEVRNFYLKKNMPIIFKPNTGGRGAGIFRINSLEDIKDYLFAKKDTNTEEYIVQELAKSIDPVDYRVFVYNDKILFGNTRTLVGGWLGSRSKGSKIEVLRKFPKGLEDIAVKASKVIGARINSLDIVRTEKGYSVIENNPTPNFNPSYVKMFGFNPVERILNMMEKDRK